MAIVFFLVLALAAWFSGVYTFHYKNRAVAVVFCGLILQWVAAGGFVAARFAHLEPPTAQRLRLVSRDGTLAGGSVSLIGLALFSRGKSTRFGANG